MSVGGKSWSGVAVAAGKGHGGTWVGIAPRASVAKRGAVAAGGELIRAGRDWTIRGESARELVRN